MGVSSPALGPGCCECPGELQVPLGLQVMTQCGMCGTSQLWGLHFPWPKHHCSPGCWNNEYSQDKVILPFAPVAGVFQGCLQQAVPTPFGGILASDRRAIWYYAETQHGIQEEPTGMAKQLHTFPCCVGWALGLGCYWAHQQSPVCRAGENGPCHTLPSWGRTERQQEK